MYINDSHFLETLTKLKEEKLSLKEYINEVCHRIDEIEPNILSLIPEEKRCERLLKKAEKLENKYSNEKPLLYGMILGVKDIFRVDGFLTKCGSELPPELFNGKEAECVTKLKENGALILGKTVTTEFAYYSPGPTRNPYNIEHTPGGSSSGSAAAVAAGLCHIAFGTQTIGSITRPAAFCGIIGFKPTYNRISTKGVIPFSISADHIGIFTQKVEDIELVLPLLFSKWNNIEIIEKPVLAIPKGKYLEQADSEALKHFYIQIDKLKSSGYTIKEIEILNDIDNIAEKHKNMIYYEMANVHSEWFNNYEELYKFHTADIIRKGRNISESALNDAILGKDELRTKLENIMKKESIDLWICPSAIGTAPKGIDSTGSPAMNLPWTYTGMPTITLPSGFDKNNLPYGLQFIAKYNEDELLVEYSKNLEKIFKI